MVLAARTVGGLEEVDDAVRAAGGSATLVPLDLRDFIKIDELAAGAFSTAGAGSTSWSATPPNSASSRRSAISIPRLGARSSTST